jgi:hypothetical protein
VLKKQGCLLQQVLCATAGTQATPEDARQEGDNGDAKRSMNVDKIWVHSKNKMHATAGSTAGTNVSIDDNNS